MVRWCRYINRVYVMLSRGSAIPDDVARKLDVIHKTLGGFIYSGERRL